MIKTELVEVLTDEPAVILFSKGYSIKKEYI